MTTKSIGLAHSDQPWDIRQNLGNIYILRVYRFSNTGLIGAL